MATVKAPEFLSRDQAPPLLRAMLRPGGGPEHEQLKMAAWLWLVSDMWEVADFEIGGFDVLGLRFHEHTSDYYLDSRIVVDAKASMNDLIAHFRKDQIPKCDIEGKFSEYANLHYIIAKVGRIKPDAVYPPWGLLEYNGSEVTVVKPAEPRAYLGSRNDTLREIAKRQTKIFGAIMQSREPEKLIKEPRKLELLKDEGRAREYILGLHDRIAKMCMAFECLYGDNPLAERFIKVKRVRAIAEE
jgi:hypothetical protein